VRNLVCYCKGRKGNSTVAKPLLEKPVDRSRRIWDDNVKIVIDEYLACMFKIPVMKLRLDALIYCLKMLLVLNV
jgi:hypothetical protein